MEQGRSLLSFLRRERSSPADGSLGGDGCGSPAGAKTGWSRGYRVVTIFTDLRPHGRRADSLLAGVLRRISRGHLTPQYNKLLDQLLKIFSNGIACVRDGAPLGDIDRILRKGIDAAGYPGQPSHPVAHGVGARAHEPPYSHQAAPGTMRSGMVLAIEPGVYWEGGGGLRLEDNFLVTARGCEKLCSYPDDFRL